MQATTTIRCRLCDGATERQFERTGDDGDIITYFKCANCCSLQTQEPSWLAAEYARSAERDYLNLDTYAVERALRLRKAIDLVWRLAGFHRDPQRQLLDWGGGVGLLVRLLRDIGIDAYLYDKYASNHFASGFEGSEDNRYSMVTAFEVFEHLVEPGSELAQLFQFDPTVLVASTVLFDDQGSDWFYLDQPQHVFFYSEVAMRQIGARFGYDVCFLPQDLIVFYRHPMSASRMRRAGWLLSHGYLSRILALTFRHRSYCDADNAAIRTLVQNRAAAAGRSQSLPGSTDGRT